MKKVGGARARGRPRTFDPDTALDRAMRVFWRRGYEGASMPELTRAMGINRPSLYAAFGNKKSLFGKALNRYVELAGGMWTDALAQPTARKAVETLLRRAVDSSAGGKIRGCLLVQGALACGNSAEPIKRELAARRARGETILRQRFEKAVADGDLNPAVDVAALARFYVTVLHGMAVQLNAGASRDEMRGVVDAALMAWPR
jgi:AcrR family transcriptional regulator